MIIKRILDALWGVFITDSKNRYIEEEYQEYMDRLNFMREEKPAPLPEEVKFRVQRILLQLEDTKAQFKNLDLEVEADRITKAMEVLKAIN